MTDIVERIRSELKTNSDERTRTGSNRYFKEPITVHGVKTAVVTRISKEHWKEVKDLEKGEVFALCEELLSSGYMEEAFVVSNWVPRLKRSFEKEDMATFAGWIDSYLDNWAKIDSFCNHSIGDLIQQYPELVTELYVWAGSPNRWMRRASAVSLVVPARRGLFRDEAFRIADILVPDRDDMVQKGYGWMLKEVSRMHQDEVFDYVIGHRGLMGRTALRYAIELMPSDRRAEAMMRPHETVK